MSGHHKASRFKTRMAKSIHLLFIRGVFRVCSRKPGYKPFLRLHHGISLSLRRVTSTASEDHRIFCDSRQLVGDVGIRGRRHTLAALELTRHFVARKQSSSFSQRPKNGILLRQNALNEGYIVIIIIIIIIILFVALCFA
ncbi:hypothetical protein L209DRAFT_748851 [Thermothelomyces heterothallicus CBS 203.75]